METRRMTPAMYTYLVLERLLFALEDQEAYDMVDLVSEKMLTNVWPHLTLLEQKELVKRRSQSVSELNPVNISLQEAAPRSEVGIPTTTGQLLPVGPHGHSLMEEAKDLAHRVIEQPHNIPYLLYQALKKQRLTGLGLTCLATDEAPNAKARIQKIMDAVNQEP